VLGILGVSWEIRKDLKISRSFRDLLKFCQITGSSAEALAIEETS
jgi:hypothetical protein